MFETILKKLRSGPETSAALHVANAEANGARPAAADALAKAEADRAALLLTGSEKEIAAAEAKIASARIALDRIDAVAAELARRSAEAETREANAALDKERDAVEAIASRIAATLIADYGKHSAPLAAMLRGLAMAEDAVLSVNSKLVAAGRAADVIAGVETRALGAGSCLENVASVLSLTSLRPVGDAEGWGTGKAVARDFNLPR